MLFGRRRGGGDDVERVVAVLNEISSEYLTKGEGSEAGLQDFHTIRQALNVASGDQRLLILTVGDEKEEESEGVLRKLFNDRELMGRFHHDFVRKEEDWQELVVGEKEEAGFLIVQADRFGMSGKVVAELSLSVGGKELKEALIEANGVFAATEERKSYREHVSEGRRQGIYFEGGVPYGEDRDGDGKIDERRGRR